MFTLNKENLSECWKQEDSFKMAKCFNNSSIMVNKFAGLTEDNYNAVQRIYKQPAI